MQKIIRWILVLFIAIGLVGCVNTTKDFEEVDITMETLQEKIENKEDFVMIVERDECSFCEAIEEYIDLTKAEHPGITLYKLDSTDFGFSSKEDDSQTLNASTEEGKAFLEIAPYFYYTPTMYVFKEGKVVDAAVGFSDADKTVSLGGLDAPIDFDTADTIDLWEFISQ